MFKRIMMYVMLGVFCTTMAMGDDKEMMQGDIKISPKKILLYSHDSYGLGHLRRSQTIARALVDKNPSLSVIIVSGSPVIGSYEYPHGVDFVRIPGVTKLHNGEYSSHQLTCPIKDLLKMRSDIILQTYRSFKPDMILVDKEPLGLRGEMVETLEAAEKDGTQVVLGLREVMDESKALAREWERKKILPALEKYYKEIWIYGPEQMGNPLVGIPISTATESKIHYTGYLHRTKKDDGVPVLSANKISLDNPYLLVMAGGGGDGGELMRAMTRLYTEKAEGLLPGLFLLGPFMPQDIKDEIKQKTENVPQVEVVYFSNQVEALISKAKAVIGMGGYNSFCEILSFKKPALIYPRTKPRLEQLIRARKAAEFGIAGLLSEDMLNDTIKLHKAVVNLQQADCLQHNFSLQGLEWIERRIRSLLS